MEGENIYYYRIFSKVDVGMLEKMRKENKRIIINGFVECDDEEVVLTPLQGKFQCARLTSELVSSEL